MLPAWRIRWVYLMVSWVTAELHCRMAKQTHTQCRGWNECWAKMPPGRCSAWKGKKESGRNPWSEGGGSGKRILNKSGKVSSNHKELEVPILIPKPQSIQCFHTAYDSIFSIYFILLCKHNLQKTVLRFSPKCLIFTTFVNIWTNDAIGIIYLYWILIAWTQSLCNSLQPPLINVTGLCS